MCNIKVKLIQLVLCLLGKVFKNLEKELEEEEISGRIETIQTVALLNLVRIFRSIQET